MWPTPHAGLDVTRTAAHWLFWDPDIYHRMTTMFATRIDRRGTGRRGPGPWLMAVLSHAVKHEVIPDRTDIALDLDDGRRRHIWHPPTYQAVKTFWTRELLDDARHESGHSHWVNQVTAEALDHIDATTPPQLTLPGIPAAVDRPSRVAHYPLGQTDRRKPV